jgi:DNA helicase-2/ATP-dependent DNA helicase PcrA
MSRGSGSVEGVTAEAPLFNDDLLVGLTPEQREAVTSTARRLMVRATAGSGKTHVLTLRIQRRIALGELEADQVLAMTFTRKAGDELRSRLFRAGIRDLRAGTFHRAAMIIVNQYREDHHLKALRIEPARKRLVTSLLKQMFDDDGIAIDDHLVPRLDAEIGWALSQGFDGATFAANAKKHRRETPIPLAQCADVLDRYVGLCHARGVVDFDLLLKEATTLLREKPRVKAAFRNRTRALFVDETQDMNPLQFQLLAQMAGDDPDLFCVGDPNQSIYGFNGANPQLLNDVVRTWPDTVVLDLTRNHRSTKAIVTVANTLLEEGARGIVPADDEGELPLVRAYDTDEDEAEHVAIWLTLHHRPGSPWKSMGVLARTNAQLDLIADALERHTIPFERRGADHGPSSDLNAEEWKKRQQEIAETDAVALSTIHRSKGLEFQHVVVVGCAEGQLPNYNATTPAELAEEARLAYVALSRAERTLLITWSRALNDPRFSGRKPSRYLAAIDVALTSLAAQRAPAAPEVRKSRLDAIRHQLEAALPPEPEPNRLRRP